MRAALPGQAPAPARELGAAQHHQNSRFCACSLLNVRCAGSATQGVHDRRHHVGTRRQRWRRVSGQHPVRQRAADARALAATWRPQRVRARPRCVLGKMSNMILQLLPGQLRLSSSGQHAALRMHPADDHVQRLVEVLIPFLSMLLQVFTAGVPEPLQPCIGSWRRSWPRARATAVRV